MHERPGALGSSRQNVIRECDASLRRLGTEFIDLYQLHHPSNEVPLDETLGALDDLVTAGKVRYVGTSSSRPADRAIRCGSRRIAPRSRVVGAPVTTPDRRIERELVPRPHGSGVTWSRRVRCARAPLRASCVPPRGSLMRRSGPPQTELTTTSSTSRQARRFAAERARASRLAHAGSAAAGNHERHRRPSNTRASRSGTGGGVRAALRRRARRDRRDRAARTGDIPPVRLRRPRLDDLGTASSRLALSAMRLDYARLVRDLLYGR